MSAELELFFKKNHKNTENVKLAVTSELCDKDGKPCKWMVENSWGAASGYKGNIIMTDEWFDEYMFRLVVERRFVPEDVLKMLEQKPVQLPCWDPMFLGEE